MKTWSRKLRSATKQQQKRSQLGKAQKANWKQIEKFFLIIDDGEGSVAWVKKKKQKKNVLIGQCRPVASLIHSDL